MKTWLLPLLVLAGVFCGSLWNANTIARETIQLQTQLELVDDFAQAESWAQAQAMLAESHRQWDAYQPYLSAVTSHSYLSNVEAMYLRAMAFCQTQEPTEFRAELADLHHQLQLLWEWEALRWGNIL